MWDVDLKYKYCSLITRSPMKITESDWSRPTYFLLPLCRPTRLLVSSRQYNLLKCLYLDTFGASGIELRY